MMPVYMIQVGGDGPVKIGHGRLPKRRLQHLQLGCPDRLRLIGTLPGAAKEEAQLHARFAGDRIRGEWFRFNPEMPELCTELASASVKGGRRIRSDPPTFRSRFCGRIRSARIAQGVTQATMAQALGIGAEAYRSYENRCLMPFRLVEPFARITGVEIEGLFRTEDAAGGCHD